MELKVGNYIRTKDGIIDKVAIDYKGKCNSPYCNCKHISCEHNYYDEDSIVKVSESLIDLIQPGDYVNDCLVYYAYCHDEDSTGLCIDKNGRRIWLDKDSQIKSVVTKEQMEAIKYEVE